MQTSPSPDRLLEIIDRLAAMALMSFKEFALIEAVAADEDQRVADAVAHPIRVIPVEVQNTVDEVGVLPGGMLEKVIATTERELAFLEASNEAAFNAAEAQ